MNIELKLTRDFERCLEDLKKKYGEDFEYLNGIHPSQLDFSEFIDNFVDKQTLADSSIDPNANANNKDIRSFMTEKGKSEDKLFVLHKIFLTIKKQLGLRTAKQWLEQEFSRGFYLNDSTTASYFPYCWANDLTRLATEGLFFLNSYNNQAPKHLTTYFDDVIEFVSFLSNRQSGAVGLPNVIIWAWYFWKNDVETGYYMKDPDYYLRQNFQKFIYRLNQPFLRIDQSSFTNVSIFDRPYVEGIFGGVEFPDGTLAIDNVEEIINCQKVFMEVVAEIRREQSMFTYPVLTYSLLKRNDFKDGEIEEMIRTRNWDIFVDKDFARWCSNHNVEWSDSNFFCSDNVGVLSNCPVSGDTDIIYYSDRYNSWRTSDIKTLYHNTHRNGDERHIKVLSNGKPVNARINKFDIPVKYKITLQNGAEIKTTADHLNKVYGKEYVRTKDLTVNDYIPFSRNVYPGRDNLGYDDGFIVGMFLGDGSYNVNSEVVFSLGDAKFELIKYLHDICPKKFGANINDDVLTSDISGKPSCTNVRVNSKYLRGLIEQFVVGNNALTKGISGKAFEQSIDFRGGIIDGLYATDGGNSGRIYTSSETLKNDIITMCATLGRVTTVSVDTRDGRLGTNPCYTVRLYSEDTTRMRQKDVYIKDEDYFWIKIKSIETIETNRCCSFCVEVIGDHEPLFTLANGIVTHNCRLLSDTSKLDAFINSIGGTALSVGSCRVSTINLVRIAYESGFDKKKYLKILRQRTLLDCKALYSMRYILKRNIEKGLLPNYQNGAVELDKQFCTIGGIGMYEVMDLFGLINTDEFGCKSYSDDAVEFATQILDAMNEVKDNFECDFTFNIEMIPAENCAGVICQADNLLFEENKYFIYSNQWIPLMEKCTIQEKCRLGSLFDEKCGGGCIAHINIENRFANDDEAWDMLNYVAAMGVIYFAFTTKISVCENRHAFISEKNCPQCGKPIADTYARVVGFYVPVSSYQKIRKMEFDKRRWMNVLSKDGIMQ